MPDAASEALRVHPLVDGMVPGGVVHRAAGPLVGLSAPLADLLLTATRAGGRVVLHTSAATRLSGALRAALRDTAGVWLVERAPGDRWNGLTGAVVAAPDAALAPMEPGTAVAPAFSAGAEPTAMQVVLAASVRHRRDTEARIGAVLHAFTSGVGAPPVAYGPHEPVDRAWDRAEAGTLLARRPDAPRLLLVGPPERPMTGSILVQPTRVGLEEVLEATVALEPGTSLDDLVPAAFERSTDGEFPLFGFVLARPGRRDLTSAPVLAHAPAPLAVLIGAPGVRDLGIDVDALVQRFDAVRVGRPRIPGVLVPLRGRLEDWETVDRLVASIGVERVARAFGRVLPDALV